MEYPPLSTSSSMEEMGGSEILQIKSSLSTPNREISSGMCMLLILQVSEMNSACESSQQNNAMGLGSSCSDFVFMLIGFETIKVAAYPFNFLTEAFATFVRPDNSVYAEISKVVEHPLGEELGGHSARSFVVARQIGVSSASMVIILL